MELTQDIQALLQYLTEHPDELTPHTLELPVALERDARKYLLTCLQELAAQGDISQEVPLLPNGRFSGEIARVYRALVDLGVDKIEDLRRCLHLYIARELLGQHPVPASAADLAILEHISHAHRYPSQWTYVVEYARQNLLLYWAENRWTITPLGQICLRLSPLQATRFLLSIEGFLHGGDYDEWHMPSSLLHQIIEEQKQNGFIELQDRHRKNNRPLTEVEHLERLGEFGVISANWQEGRGRLTRIGRAIIDSVIARDSFWDPLVEAIVREALTGRGLSVLGSPQDLQRVRQLVLVSSIVGDQQRVLLSELERLASAEPEYLSIFRALAPSIEGILRNIASAEGVKEGRNIGEFIGILRGQGKGILSESTLRMLDIVYKPYRDLVEHGHTLSGDIARMLCETGLGIIEAIHQDHNKYLERQNPTGVGGL